MLRFTTSTLKNGSHAGILGADLATPGDLPEIIHVFMHNFQDQRTEEVKVYRSSVVSPGGAETEDGATVRRGAPVTVRRADERQQIGERPAPDETRV